MLHRAYSLLTVKSIDAATRTIRGMATTPTPDRLGDVIDPHGAQYAKEIPLLLHHQRHAPVGTARLGTATDAGIPFEAEIAHVPDPGPVQQETDRAWTSIVHKLIRGVSIGFRPVGSWDDAIEPIPGGGLKFLKTEILELSLVTVPANQDATLSVVRSIDQAAFGQTSPRAGGPVARLLPAKDPTMTIAEQITQWSNTRAPKVDRLAGLMKTAAETGVTLDATQADEYEGLKAEVKSIDDHLARLRDMETLNIAAAVPVPATPAPKLELVHTPRATPIIQVKSTLPPATAFIRYCQAKAYGRGDTMKEIAFASQWKDSTPEVEAILRAAVAAGNTTNATWAGPLAPIKPLANEFMALLRPATLLGKIPNLRTVPFNVSVPVQTGGGTYAWVGEGAPKPVGSLAFSTIVLTITKCAGIIVITDELARNSTPDAESVIRGDMIAGIAQFLDVQFTDPTKAPVANVSPGSITNGVTPITSAGTSPANARTDIQALINAMTAANISTAGSVLLMSESNAAVLSFALNGLGQPLFPDMNSTGGSALGIKVVTSQSAGNNVILLAPSTVLYADDGGVTIDISTEASLQMDSAPAAVPDATTVFTSLWQNNYVGLRAERYINWKRGRTGGVQYTVQAYVA